MATAVEEQSASPTGGSGPAGTEQHQGAPAPAPRAGAGEHPGFIARGRARRRARFLRKARELAYRDLGGLVFNLHRFGQRNDALVLAKLTTLGHIDSELRALEDSLEEHQPITVLSEAGITACARCAAIHSSEDRFCPNCGLPLHRHANLPADLGAISPSAPAPAAQAPAAAASPAPVPPATPRPPAAAPAAAGTPTGYGSGAGAGAGPGSTVDMAALAHEAEAAPAAAGEEPTPAATPAEPAKAPKPAQRRSARAKATQSPAKPDDDAPASSGGEAEGGGQADEGEATAIIRPSVKGP
jgi:hypothetical protein